MPLIDGYLTIEDKETQQDRRHETCTCSAVAHCDTCRGVAVCSRQVCSVSYGNMYTSKRLIAKIKFISIRWTIPLIEERAPLSWICFTSQLKIGVTTKSYISMSTKYQIDHRHIVLCIPTSYT